MRRVIDITVRLLQVGKRAYTRKWSFLGVFAIVLFGGVNVLGQLDLLPNPSPAYAAPTVVLATDQKSATSTTTEVVVSELPMKIEIPAINLSSVIENPITTNTEILDQNLLKGAVRYPTSAKLGEIGNVVLFGHSSYLPVVINQAYKTFNGIQKLVPGDVVTVYSLGTAYSYRVRSMEKESTNNAGIPLLVSGKVLTLSTCDSFGAKTDRFVVTADFVESHTVSN
jgi:LPXTG-site transpeptidase (sortase) family protein